MNVKTKNLIHLERGRIRHFSELDFYQVKGAPEMYADATQYLQKRGLAQSHSVEEFRSKFAPWISAMQKAFEIEADELFLCNQDDGHELIDEMLSILFIAYTNEYYCAGLVERMFEMEVCGVAISDSRLLYDLSLRFTEEQLLNTIKNDNE